MHPIARIAMAVLLALSLQAAEASAAKPGTSYDVYILIGQSNAEGRGLKRDIPAELAQPSQDHIIFYHNGVNATDDWRPLEPGYSAKKKAALPAGQFGIEVTFAPAMAGAVPGMKVAIIKASVGSTSISSHWNPGSDANGLNGKSPGGCYRTALDAINLGVAKLPPGKHRLRGILWHQGENDAGNGNYDKALGNLIKRLREDLQAPDLPFVFGELGKSLGPKLNPVMARTVDAVPHTAMVSAKDVEGGLHFTSAGYLELGKRYAVAMAGLQKDLAPRLLDGGMKQATLRTPSAPAEQAAAEQEAAKAAEADSKRE